MQGCCTDITLLKTGTCLLFRIFVVVVVWLVAWLWRELQKRQRKEKRTWEPFQGLNVDRFAERYLGIVQGKHSLNHLL